MSVLTQFLSFQIPANYRVACAQIPEMEAAFTEAFPSCTEANICDCGSDSEASVIVGRPELAFLTGVRYYLLDYNTRIRTTLLGLVVQDWI